MNGQMDKCFSFAVAAINHDGCHRKAAVVVAVTGATEYGN